MTQGMPVIAGVDNTAGDTTGVTASMTSGTGMTVSNSSVNFGEGLSVTNTCAGIIGAAISAISVRTANSTRTGGSAVNASIQTPDSTAVYAIGRGRGVYAVGTDDVAVSAYSYNSNGTYSYGKLNGVMGASDNSSASGVYGENRGKGFGVAGRTLGVGRRALDPGAGVWGDHATAGEGVRGTSVTGIGVLGRTSGSVAVLAENLSGRANTTAVTALGGSGVGLRASGTRAAIRLDPAVTQGAPTTGAHEMGELMVDSNGDLFLCKASGTPGTWVRVA